MTDPVAEPGTRDDREASILYCHCAFAKVIDPAVKDQVLEALVRSGVPFEAAPDLCEMSARKDPALGRLAGGEGKLRIAACFPRAVHWLFHSAGIQLDGDRVQVLNMREAGSEEVVEKLLAPDSEDGDAYE